MIQFDDDPYFSDGLVNFSPGASSGSTSLALEPLFLHTRILVKKKQKGKKNKDLSLRLVVLWIKIYIKHEFLYVKIVWDDFWCHPLKQVDLKEFQSIHTHETCRQWWTVSCPFHAGKAGIQEILRPYGAEHLHKKDMHDHSMKSLDWYFWWAGVPPPTSDVFFFSNSLIHWMQVWKSGIKVEHVCFWMKDHQF